MSWITAVKTMAVKVNNKEALENADKAMLEFQKTGAPQHVYDYKCTQTRQLQSGYVLITTSCFGNTSTHSDSSMTRPKGWPNGDPHPDKNAPITASYTCTAPITDAAKQTQCDFSILEYQKTGANKDIHVP